jgi:ketosteroid isomerase-like protein
MPARLSGQQEIRDFATGTAAAPLRIDDLEAVAVHHTDDPEVVIVELVTRGTLTSTGRTFAGTSMQVFRIRDGKIVLFRDYFNLRGLDELLGS